MVDGAQDVLLFEEHVQWAEQLATALCQNRRIPDPDRRQHGRVGLWRAIKRRRSSNSGAIRSCARKCICGTIAGETTRTSLFGDTRKFSRAGVPVPVALPAVPDVQASEPADDTCAQARELVASLPWDLRLFADAYWLRGLSETEVAGEMGCSPSTVSNRLYECVQLLRESVAMEG